MSLARGLDYYTGIIYEAIVEASAPPGFKQADALTPTSESTDPTPKPDPKKKPKKKVDEEGEEEIDESQVGVGSIAAGGRYDNLVGMFLSAASGEGKKTASIPCVGVSMGLDRIFAILWPGWVERGMRSKGTMVYVMSAGDGLLQERVQLVQALRESGINVSPYVPRRSRMLTTVVIVRPSFHSRTSRNCQPSSQLGRRTKFHSLLSSAETSSKLVSSPSKSKSGSLKMDRRSRFKARRRARKLLETNSLTGSRIPRHSEIGRSASGYLRAPVHSCRVLSSRPVDPW